MALPPFIATDRTPLERGLPRTTNKEEQKAVVDGRGGLGGETVIKYGIFLTDGFSGNAAGEPFLYVKDENGDRPELKNDESYRRSRHLLNSSSAEQRRGVGGADKEKGYFNPKNWLL